MKTYGHEELATLAGNRASRVETKDAARSPTVAILFTANQVPSWKFVLGSYRSKYTWGPNKVGFNETMKALLMGVN